MTKTKSTKRALLTSGLALLLCVSMFVGSTFAWFTDSVTNGVNKIVSGNLDVELYHMNYAEAAKESEWNVGFGIPQDAEGEKVGTDTKLFLSEDGKEMLWEPGATSVENFRIKNEGSLALKYQFRIDFYNATETPDGKTLADIINISAEEINYQDNGVPTGNRDGIANLADRKLGDGYIFEGYLLPEQEYNFWVALQWVPTDIDNEFNVKGGLSIDLGITLLATQYTYEKDSYNGDQYDQGATYPLVYDYPVTKAEDLKAALENGFDVTLGKDITMDESIVIPEGVTSKLNLNGKTLSAATAGAMITNNGTLTVKDGTIENTAVNGGATINNKGTLVLEDGANIVGAPIASDSGYPAYCITNAGNLTIEAGASVSADRGCLFLSGTGETVINGGSFTNNDIAPKLNNREFTSHVVVVGYGANNKLTINDGTFQHLHTSTSGGVVINNWSAVTVDVKGGNFSGGNYFGKWDNLSDYGYGSTKTPFSVTGGIFTGMDNKFIAAGYKAVENNGVYHVVPENVHAIVDNRDELQNALDTATNETVIYVNNDITGDVTATQKPDVKITIDGKGYNYAGVITVDGKSGTYLTAGLTIKNLNFVADSISADACIQLGKNNASRYTCNVTVDGCTFDVPGAVGVKSYTGGDKNLTITGCTATAKAHSLVQAKGIDGVLVEYCKVYSKNGLNFNNSDNVTISYCEVDVKGYAVRFGESSGGVGAAETYKIENSTLKSQNDDGDATIILRGTADYATLTIVKTTVEGTPDIANTAKDSTIIIDGVHITPIVDKAPAPYVGDMYDEGTNVVSYKDLELKGDSYISIDNNAPVAIENVTADVNGSVIVMDEYQPAIYIKGCDFTIDAGEYLIDASAVEGGVYQIFLVDVKVNGEYLTDATAALYLNNVNWYQALQSNNS